MGPREAWLMTLLLASLAIIPLVWGPGIVNTRAGGDSPFLIQRLHQLVMALRAGQFPPRWMPDAAYGLGYPFFNFYAALPYYVAALLKAIGFGYLWSIKLTQVVGFMAAAAAMYGLVLRVWRDRGAALVAALAYTYAPFHLVNVYVRGDSLSEFYAFIFYPLIVHALVALHERVCWPRVAWLALAYGGLILTHNVSALIFSPFVALGIVLLLLARREGRVRWLIASGAGLVGGLMLSAWFWWPALRERGWGHMADMTTGYFHYSGHFRGLDLVQLRLLFDYAVTADRTPFVTGLVQALVALGGMVALIVSCRRLLRDDGEGLLGKRALFFGFAALSFMIATWLITPLSRLLWDHLPLLPMVQFPWRFLSIQAFAVALLAVPLVQALPRSRWAALAISALLIVSALGALRPERLEIGETDVTTERLRLYELFTGNIGSTVRYEYLPQWADPRPFMSEAAINDVAKAPPLVVAGEATAELALAQGREVWDVQVTSDGAELAFQTYYFPGWRAWVDGQSVAISPLPGLGYIRLSVPFGAHRVELAFGRTRSRALGEGISLLALLALLGALLWEPVRTRRFWRQVVIGIGLLFLLALVLRLAPDSDVSRSSDLSMDFPRQPYLHHNRDGIRFADGVRLVEYTLDADTAQAGGMIGLELRWNQAAPELVAEARLVSFGEPLFAIDEPLAVATAAIATRETRHTLAVPEQIVPGWYLLSVRVWNGTEELLPRNARGETLGTTYLRPVRVASDLRAIWSGDRIADFGEELTLVQAAAVQTDPTHLQVDLLWQVRRQPLRNDAMSVRLRGHAGRQVAALDIQPQDYLYPTSFWRAGELVPDRVILTLPEGTPPAPDYALEIVLYDATNLQPRGQATIPGIQLTQLTIRRVERPLHTFDEIALLAVSVEPPSPQEGQIWMMQLAWGAASKPTRNYVATIQIRAGGSGEWNDVRLAPSYPTTSWPEGALVVGHYPLGPLPAGDYGISILLRDADTSAVVGSYDVPEPLRVQPRPRDWVVPKMQTRLDVTLTPIRLLGVDQAQRDRTLELTLYWQAIEDVSADYKVFVHVFDPSQEKIVAQVDTMPRQNQYPTHLWVAGEVVRDPLTISLADVPSGTYRIAIGLYDPQTDVRLAVAEGEGVTISDNRVILPVPVRVR